jgi:hypothetical protein
MRILAGELPAIWANFVSAGTKSYEQNADEFRAAQPDIWNILKKLDEEWFSAKTDHVVAYGVFVWKVVTSAYGVRNRVPQHVIDELRREEELFYASLEDESEFAIKKAMDERRRTHPEPVLAAHIEHEFQEGSAKAKELNPMNNDLAVRALLITIDALIRMG